MKARADLVRGWLRKAESDRVAMEASLDAGAYDAACFHAQQAVEKLFKTFLIHSGLPLVHTHNLEKLLDQCASVEPAFRSLTGVVAPLTPYAVEVRYDDDFWPACEEAEAARAAARKAAAFVRSRLRDTGHDSPSQATAENWRSARDKFDWRVDLRAFQHKEDYPGYFDRVIEPVGVAAFEDQFRCAVKSGAPFQRAGEVYFWKTIRTKRCSAETKQLLQHLSEPERWNAFRDTLRTLAEDPSYPNFKRFQQACGHSSGFAVEVCFLAFYDPGGFPLADKHVACWWAKYLQNPAQGFRQRAVDGLIQPCEQSWEAYLAWTNFCRQQAQKLTESCGRHWRPRDVEMAVWVGQKQSIRLEPL